MGDGGNYEPYVQQQYGISDLRGIKLADRETGEQWYMYGQVKEVFAEKLQGDACNSLHPVIRIQNDFLNEYPTMGWVLGLLLVLTIFDYGKMFANRFIFQIKERKAKKDDTGT